MNFLTSELMFYILAAFALVTGLLVVIKGNPVGSAICLALCFAAAAGIMFQLDAQFLGTIQILVYTGAIMVLIIFVVMLLNLKEEKKTFVRPLPLVCGLAIAVLFMAQLIGVVYSIPGACETKPYMCSENVGRVWDELGFPENNQETSSVDFEGEIDFEGLLAEDIQIDRGDGSVPITIREAMLERRYFADAIPAIGHSPALSPSACSRLHEVEYPEGSSIAESVKKGQFPDTALLGHRLYSKYNKELVVSGLALLVAAIGSVVLTRRPKNN